MKIVILLCFLTYGICIFAHDGHEMQEAFQQESPHSWAEWAGRLHLTALHFPIALINLLVCSELLRLWRRQPIYEFTARFLLFSSAIITVPTALLGLIYSYSAPYEDLMATFLRWHMWLGIVTAIFTIILLLMREKQGLGRLYYSCLFVLFMLINITSYFGGAMTFGPYHLFPPI